MCSKCPGCSVAIGSTAHAIPRAAGTPPPSWHLASGRQWLGVGWAPWRGGGGTPLPMHPWGWGLEEVAKAVGGGYCRLQMPLKLALGVTETVAGHRLGALEEGYLPPFNASPPPFTHGGLPPSKGKQVHTPGSTNRHTGGGEILAEAKFGMAKRGRTKLHHIVPWYLRTEARGCRVQCH